MKKTQIVHIRWWETFKNDEDFVNYLKNCKVSLEEKNKWHKSFLKNELKDECTIIKPDMPLRQNARYSDWKIVFNNYLEVLDNEIILIWTSLWWIFLAKYLSENKINKKIISTFIIAAPFDDTLPWEDLVWGFELGNNLSQIEKNSQNTRFMYSWDDPVVPLEHSEKYKEKLKNSEFFTYNNNFWHFQMEEFPEIVEIIKNDLKNYHKK